MSKLKNVNWLQLAIDVVKVLIGALGGAIATTNSESVNQIAYLLKTTII